MSDRVRSSDVSFLHLERRTGPQHVGGLAVFEPPPGGFDYQRLVALLEERIAVAPRFRQRLRGVPAGLGNPVWADDPSFDLTFHVRRSALPGPATRETLLAFAALVQSRPLDRTRPLWEMYFVEGLPANRFAVVTKTHPSLVDGTGEPDLAAVLLDESRQPRRTVAPVWMPEPEPDGWALALAAVRDAARQPADLVRAARAPLADARSTVRWALDTAATLARPVLPANSRALLPPAGGLPARRLAAARLDLELVGAVHRATGASVNDVVLAVVTGAIRRWLLARDGGLVPTAEVRALAPLAVRSGREDTAARVVATLVALPVGEPDVRARLDRVRQQTAAVLAARPTIGADALITLSGYAPFGLHALGARAAAGLTGRLFDLPVMNVPGPQRPRYAGGARMVEMYAFPPLPPGKPLSVGVMSYDGSVFVGLTADRAAVGDLPALAAAVPAAARELAAAVPAAAGQPAARPARSDPRAGAAPTRRTGSAGGRR